MPLYEDLVRRAMAAKAKAAGLQLDAARIRAFAQILRDARDGKGDCADRRSATGQPTIEDDNIIFPAASAAVYSWARP